MDDYTLVCCTSSCCHFYLRLPANRYQQNAQYISGQAEQDHDSFPRVNADLCLCYQPMRDSGREEATNRHSYKALENCPPLFAIWSRGFIPQPTIFFSLNCQYMCAEYHCNLSR